MNRPILEACLPGLVALVAAFVVLRLLVRLSGARFDWRRLRGLHRCQDGGVQSLAFVITLPLFLVIVMFIVQVSQLMIGIVVVNYAAFAAARSASVWIPAHVMRSPTLDEYAAEGDAENRLPPPPWNPPPIEYLGGDEDDSYVDGRYTYNSYKYERIFATAVLACAPIAPSRDYGYELEGPALEVSDAAKSVYRAVNPASERNRRTPRRLGNKIAYSYWNTVVQLSFADKNSRSGPTYSPPTQPSPTGYWELGWQDPVTVTVAHRLALLPGAGRFLAKYIVRPDGGADLTAATIGQPEPPNGEPLYTVNITAAATMTNEGFKPVLTYVQRP